MTWGFRWVRGCGISIRRNAPGMSEFELADLARERRQRFAALMESPSIEGELFDAVVDGKSLVAWSHEQGVRYSWIARWLGAEPRRMERYRAALAIACERIAQEVLDIADNETGEMEQNSAAKVRIDARLKLLAKWSPKIYGDKTQLEHTGGGGGAIQVITGVPASPETLGMKDMEHE